MNSFKNFFNETTNRLTPSKGDWYHGDQNQRSNFKDQKMDRDASMQQANEHGPGIYFTRSFQNALHYAYPNGYVYTAQMNIGNKIIKDKMKTNVESIKKLIDWCPEERKMIGLSNWGENPDIALKEALKAYSNYYFMEACLAVYHDFYGYTEANEWANSMVNLGIDAYWRILSNPDNEHLIIYNPNIIKILKEYHASTAEDEFYNNQ